MLCAASQRQIFWNYRLSSVGEMFPKWVDAYVAWDEDQKGEWTLHWRIGWFRLTKLLLVFIIIIITIILMLSEGGWKSHIVFETLVFAEVWYAKQDKGIFVVGEELSTFFFNVS